jgi:ATPase subunit of ABC transporter with duplicated ATPase domains
MSLTEKPERLTVESQASRFHAESQHYETLAVHLRGLNMTFGHRDLLTEAELKLVPGMHYGLIGRNGVGKSLLLKSLAYKWIPNLDPSLNIYYMEQLDRAEQLSVPIMDLMLYHSDRQRASVYRQIDMLEMSLKRGNQEAMETALLAVERFAAQEALALARNDTIRQTGARGAAARRRLNELEEEFKKIQIQNSDGKPVQILVQEKLDAFYSNTEDRASLEARSAKILHDFGFTAEDYSRPLSEFSGGWRIRVSLAMTLLLGPDILICKCVHAYLGGR